MSASAADVQEAEKAAMEQVKEALLISGADRKKYGKLRQVGK